MTFREFLSDRIGGIMLRLTGIGAAALFLAATGTQAGVIVILLLFFLLAGSAALTVDFLRQRSRIAELESIMEHLDQKYLFTECISPSGGVYERRLFELTRRASRAMMRAVSDAESAQREYRESIESWVHEIKTPLTAARLLCRHLDGNMRRKMDYELAQIESHIERALFYARTENPDRDYVIRQTDLSEIVFQAIENHRTLLIQSGVRIETQNLDYPIYTDKKWAVFILGQLLQNSARYRGADPLIAISAGPLGKQIQLTIQDNGIGVPAHELPRIFDRGFTGSNGRSRGGSTGMGLYLCKKLSGFLELDIHIASEKGAWTRATLTFPARENLTKL